MFLQGKRVLDNEKVKRVCIWVGVILCAWMAVLCLDLWKVQKEDPFDPFSEALVWCRISDAQKGTDVFAGMLRGYSEQDGIYQSDSADLYAADALPTSNLGYSGQFGLQGDFFSLVAKLMEKENATPAAIQNFLWQLNTFFFVVCVLLLAVWAATEMGKMAAIGVLSCLLFSPWIHRGIANLYWVTWTMLLPTVVAAFTGKRLAEKGKAETRYYVAIFLAILLRFLCGFEFVPTVMLATEMPLLYYFLKSKDAGMRKKLFWLAFSVGVIELASFVIAVGLTVVRITAWKQQGLMAGLQELMDHVVKRTGWNMTQADLQSYKNQEMVESLEASRLSVVNAYLTSSEILWGNLSVKGLYFLCIVTSFAKKVEAHISTRTVAAEMLFVTASMLPAISWFFLASGHAYVHTHIDYIIWMLPFVPICVGYIFQNGYEIIKAFSKKDTYAENLR